MAGARRPAVRLLPGRAADVGGGAPRANRQPERRADRDRHERQRLPVRRIHANQGSDSPRGQRRAEGIAMKNAMKNTTASTHMDRRSFLQVTALAGGGVV